MSSLLPKVHQRIKLSTGFTQRGSKVRSRYVAFTQTSHHVIAWLITPIKNRWLEREKVSRVWFDRPEPCLPQATSAKFDAIGSLLFLVPKALIVARRATGNACRKFDKTKEKVIEKCVIVWEKWADRRKNWGKLNYIKM